MAHISLALTVAALLVITQGVSAKRGCSAFGHSCFGGHGKRSGDTSPLDITSQDMIAGRQVGQEETPPHPGYPRSGYSGALSAGDDIIPIRDGGVYERGDGGRELMKLKLRNIFKHWVDNYRRSQQTDNGDYLDSL